LFGTAFSNKYKDDYTLAPGMLHSLSAKFAASIGFDAYMPKTVRTRIVAYPPAAIAAVVTTLDMIVSAPPFLTLLGDGAWVSMKNPDFLNNLVAKNFLWINYHPIVYFAFFPLIGMYYTLIPIFAKKTFSSQRWVRAPWPLLLITGVGVYSHHLFMDTSQPEALQIMSQNMSMLIGLASGISVFTLFALIWRSKYQWSLTARFFFASIIGWIVGGVMGVEQGNIALDIYEHNTYLIVSHFHFNALDGIVLAGFGVFYFILPEISNKQWYSQTLAEIHFWGTCIGGFGLAGTFAVMGFLGVPRREFQPIQTGLPFTVTLDYHFWLVLAFFFAIVAAAAQVPFIWNLIKTLLGPKITPVATPVEPEAIVIPATAPIARGTLTSPEFSNPVQASGDLGPEPKSMGQSVQSVDSLQSSNLKEA
ncbi:MAG: cbb3-type cytochrome c oxidase subunit I, partial [Nitrososphaerales archaeon]